MKQVIFILILFSVSCFGQWTQVGNAINGQMADDRCGYSTAISADGSIVAVGSSGNSNGGSDAGQVRVFVYANDGITQKSNHPYKIEKGVHFPNKILQHIKEDQKIYKSRATSNSALYPRFRGKNRGTDLAAPHTPEQYFITKQGVFQARRRSNFRE